MTRNMGWIVVFFRKDGCWERVHMNQWILWKKKFLKIQLYLSTSIVIDVLRALWFGNHRALLREAKLP